MKMQMTFCDDKRKQILAERWMTLPVKWHIDNDICLFWKFWKTICWPEILFLQKQIKTWADQRKYKMKNKREQKLLSPGSILLANKTLVSC